MAGKLKKKQSLRGKDVGEHRLCSGSYSRDRAGSLSKVADESVVDTSTDNTKILDESSSKKSLNEKTVDELFDYILHNLKETGKILCDSELNNSLNQVKSEVKSTSASNVETTKLAKSSCTFNHRRKRT
ncbi:uncharacterized protein LOC117169376 [Belonocnema kinseyi]|uniref:uncharacterized protein LOC117169376 n=1 Tax=Belonocnema kinseyi TaxID=2817044 RepID=UPI00143DABFF|nr:uncharacterized protein LOC117169376 [Belonocnema kinseyi]XP_033211619.1 uncharacterized protein LOC117169376 [Belonocnema kinseyi]